LDCGRRGTNNSSDERRGKDINEGFDGFVPLVDSGIYIGVWMNQKSFFSTIIYTCGEFDAEKAVGLVEEIFRLF